MLLNLPYFLHIEIFSVAFGKFNCSNTSLMPETFELCKMFQIANNTYNTLQYIKKISHILCVPSDDQKLRLIFQEIVTDKRN